MLARLAQEQKAVSDPLPLVVAKPQPADWMPPKKVPKPGEKGF